MQFATMGLVVKEVKVGEADRILTLLTERFGLIKASARGARNLKNRLFSATGMFCYAEFTLFTQKGNYYVDEAALQQNFFGLRNSVEALSVAAYIAELLCALQPHRPEEVHELLRLALNSLYVLCNGPTDWRQVKAVFELRAVSEAGFRPDLVACTACGRYEDKAGFWFDKKNGRLYCSRCCEGQCHDPDTPLSVVTAMRHSIYADLKKIFSFTLSADSLRRFYECSEEYVRFQLDRPLKSLDFLHAACDTPPSFAPAAGPVVAAADAPVAPTVSATFPAADAPVTSAAPATPPTTSTTATDPLPEQADAPPSGKDMERKHHDTQEL